MLVMSSTFFFQSFPSGIVDSCEQAVQDELEMQGGKCHTHKYHGMGSAYSHGFLSRGLFPLRRNKWGPEEDILVCEAANLNNTTHTYTHTGKCAHTRKVLSIRRIPNTSLTAMDKSCTAILPHSFQWGLLRITSHWDTCLPS